MSHYGSPHHTVAATVTPDPAQSLPRRIVAAWRRLPQRKRGYVAAIFVASAATLAGLLLGDFLSASIFMLFAAPVAMAAWYAGRSEAEGYAKQLKEQALELAAAHLSLKKSTGDQLAEAQALARLGSWEWNISDNELEWSDEMYRLYGLEPGTDQISFERYQSLLHPDDRETAREVVGHALQTGEAFSFDHRVVDGAIGAAFGNVVMRYLQSPALLLLPEKTG